MNKMAKLNKKSKGNQKGLRGVKGGLSITKKTKQRPKMGNEVILAQDNQK